jgi:hypothetical protein
MQSTDDAGPRHPVCVTPAIGTTRAFLANRPHIRENALQASAFGPPTLFLIRKLRNYIEAFGF